MKPFKINIKQRLTGRHLKCFEFCGDLKEKTILNIGSSFGWFEKMALKAGVKKIIGIEPEEKLFYQARQEVPEAEFRVGSALKIPSKNHCFDLVALFDVIEHLPKKTEIKALKEIKRVLKPEGKLVLSTPFDFWLSNVLDPAWYFGHRHYRTQELVALLEKAGFKIEEIEAKGGIAELISMILLYFFKLFNREIPFKEASDRFRKKEYLDSKYQGFVTLFIKAGIK